jgi:hypothetical protein
VYYHTHVLSFDYCYLFDTSHVAWRMGHHATISHDKRGSFWGMLCICNKFWCHSSIDVRLGSIISHHSSPIILSYYSADQHTSTCRRFCSLSSPFTSLPFRRLFLPARSLPGQHLLVLHLPSLPSLKTCTGKVNTHHPRSWDPSCPRCHLVSWEFSPSCSSACAAIPWFRLLPLYRNQVPLRMEPGSSGTTFSWDGEDHWRGALTSRAGFSARTACKETSAFQSMTPFVHFGYCCFRVVIFGNAEIDVCHYGTFQGATASSRMRLELQ